MKLHHLFAFLCLTYSLQASASFIPFPELLSKKLPPHLATILKQKVQQQQTRKISAYPRIINPQEQIKSIKMLGIDHTHNIQLNNNQNNTLLIRQSGFGEDSVWYMEEVVAPENAKTIHDYLTASINQQQAKNTSCLPHLGILQDKLFAMFQENSGMYAGIPNVEYPSKNAQDIHLIHVDANEFINTYRFAYGAREVSIQYVKSTQTTPLISWHAPKSKQGEPVLDTDQDASYREMTKDEVFLFLIVLQRHQKEAETTLLSQEQEALMEDLQSYYIPATELELES